MPMEAVDRAQFLTSLHYFLSTVITNVATLVDGMNAVIPAATADDPPAHNQDEQGPNFEGEEEEEEGAEEEGDDDDDDDDDATR